MTTFEKTLIAALALSLSATVSACGKSSSNGGGAAGKGSNGSGSGGSNGGGSGSGGSGSGGLCQNQDDDNLDCPQVPPVTGVCAPKGVCCHRSSNAVKEKALGPNDDLVLEYRLNYFGVINHPMTIGQDLVKGQNTQVYDNEQQSQLWRLQFPRKDGKEISGMGKSTIGVGRYNCDGTYSYYSNKAAPSVMEVSTDPARYAPNVVDTVVDVTKDGADRFKVPFATNPNRNLAYTPYLNLNTFAYDWEAVSQGFKIIKTDTSEAARDCIGKRSGMSWMSGGQVEVYTPLKFSNSQVITSIMETLGNLTAFGITSDKTLDCNKTDRCMPGSSNCKWLKLPDSLCPVDDTERALFGCHLGAKGNVNGETGYPDDSAIKCSMDKPTSAQDPDAAGGMTGQCCDPMGMNTNGLPACNAYRLIEEFVAAAAEITDNASDQLQQDCTKAGM